MSALDEVDKERSRIIVIEFDTKEQADEFDAAPHNKKLSIAIQMLAKELWPRD